MTTALRIPVTKVKVTKLLELNLYNVPFGKYFSDHMLDADYVDGTWTQVAIKPYQPIPLSPSLSALHYGQSVFEGLKAYRSIQGGISIFRFQDSFERFNKSAARMQMPSIPKEIFLDGIRQLVALDASWVPGQSDHSLYIRPFMFATDDAIGVKPSDRYKFMVILSPSGPYYSAPLKISVEENFVRACPGGVGSAKVAGNYGSSMLATAMAKKEGYDQVLWMDAIEHKYVQEMGLMNFFFIRRNIAVTPNIDQGTILQGITRDSCIVLLKELGYRVEERPLGIDEIVDAYKANDQIELFGTGTAATISFISHLRYKDFIMEFNPRESTVAPLLKKMLLEIREGKIEDRYSWLFPLWALRIA